MEDRGLYYSGGESCRSVMVLGRNRIEERDAIRDRMKYLVNVKKNLWMEPRFKWFGDIGEVRKSVSAGALRVYGYFPDGLPVFVFLLGVVKKTTKDHVGVDVARTRLKRLKNGRVIHMSLISRRGLLQRIRRGKQARAQLVASNLSEGIAFQIRATRDAQEMTQAELARSLG